MNELEELNRLLKYKYSNESLKNLIGVHPRLVEFALTIANFVDCKIVYGVRSEEEQYKLYKLGLSSLDGRSKKSAHQVKEDGYGYALDILPLPKGINMYLDDGSEDNIRWGQFDGFCHGVAAMLSMKIKTGFKWRDNIMESLARPEKANTLPDGNHIELIV